MKFLIIGLGSMGKRRIRNLKAIGSIEVIGFDMREDRRKEAEEKYGIKTFATFEEAVSQNPDALIISTPPQLHNPYIKLAIEHKKPAFVEASVIIDGLKELDGAARKAGVMIAPSCTFRYHPAVREIKEIVDSAKYGKVTNFTYFLGQYLPDWHPHENIKNFYVGQKETSGAREMVSFEMTWLVDVFGFPKSVKGFFGKTLDMGADIDDTYAFALDMGNKFGSVLIDVVARYAVRNIIINLEKAQITWRWDENFIKIYDAESQKWEQVAYDKGKAASGYNENIGEEMYIEEMKIFADSVASNKPFPNTLEEDIKVLQILNDIEKNGK
jgi:predicted dehydrogenase